MSKKNHFDTKLGAEFIKNTPTTAGVYQVIDCTGTTIYVGKAKNLKRRLSQYRNSKRTKKHMKMFMIIKLMQQIQIHHCGTEQEALYLENKMIQEHRPKFNVDGAFSFLYPFIGIYYNKSVLKLFFTSRLDAAPQSFRYFGAFRSRARTRRAYFAACDLLEYLGHRENEAFNPQQKKFSYQRSFRRVDEHWKDLLIKFLSGESEAFLEKVVFYLLEKPSARRAAADIQENIEDLYKFYKFDAQRLRQVLKAVGKNAANISQEERDTLFLKYRFYRITQSESESVPDLEKPFLNSSS